MFEFERRIEPSFWWSSFSVLLAVSGGLILTSMLLVTSGAQPFDAFFTLFQGAFGSWRALATTAVKATPLILTGLAAVIAFRANIWSIGQEGQLFAGAIAAYAGGLFLRDLPPVAFAIGVLLCGIFGGMFMGWLTASLKNRFTVNEIVSTVMLNYLVVYFLSYLLSGGPLAETGEGVSFQQSNLIPQEFRLPLLIEGTRLHVGVLAPIVAAIVCHILLNRTARGYEIRALGFNPVALDHKGVNSKRTILFIMCFSGALAALAGVIELYGVGFRLKAEGLVGLGYAGIIIAMIGGLTPIGTVIAGILFGALASGAVAMRVASDVPAALIPAMQAIMLLCFLCAGVLARYRIKWLKMA